VEKTLATNGYEYIEYAANSLKKLIPVYIKKAVCCEDGFLILAAVAGLVWVGIDFAVFAHDKDNDSGKCYHDQTYCNDKCFEYFAVGFFRQDADNA